MDEWRVVDSLFVGLSAGFSSYGLLTLAMAYCVRDLRKWSRLAIVGSASVFIGAFAGIIAAALITSRPSS